MVVILIVGQPTAATAADSDLNSSTTFSLVSSSSSQVEAEATVATTREEEWVTKKKTELTTTRQIETRVKRQVVLEDGKVVGDSGPIVTTSTTEDTEKQEHQQKEHRTSGDDSPPEGDEWQLAPSPDGLVKEVRERTVTSREEREERVETEDIKHLGDLTDDAYLSAVRSGQDVRRALSDRAAPNSQQLVATSTPKEVHRSSRSHRITDTTDTVERSAVTPDGRLLTETRKTSEREEVKDKEDPDSGEDEVRENRQESSQRHATSRDQEVVQYLADGVKIGEEMRYLVEEREGERQGDAEPADLEWDSLSTRVRRMRRAAAHQADRKDALTKRPLDFDLEEETRKVETSKWLEHHFGSESRSSKDSADDDDLPQATGNNTSFINVTMKSRPITRKSTSPSPVNGHSGKSYVATVNASSRVFVSSPEPDEVHTPPPPPPPATNGGTNSYFHGVSEWSERRNRSSPAPVTAVTSTPVRPERVQVRQPLRHVNGHAPAERNASLLSAGSSVQTPPGRASPYRGDKDRELPSGSFRDSPVRINTVFHQREREQEESYRRGFNGRDREEDTAPADDGYRVHYRPWERFRRRQTDDSDGGAQEVEPPPDYSPPPPHASPSPSPSPPPTTTSASPAPVANGVKKVYQRTRFAADIPPASRQQPSSTPTPPPHHKSSASSIISESFRKLVGKFRTSSSERKASKRRGSKRSPSPPRRAEEAAATAAVPVAPPRGTRQSRSSHAAANMQRRFYLGEDPFGGSIYGREKEYDGVVPARRRHRQVNGHRRIEDEELSRTPQNGISSLGRLSKSTSRLTTVTPPPSSASPDYSRTAQTLPRKLYEDHGGSRIKRSLYSQQKNSLSNGVNSNSTINVSIINNVTPQGPAKPARTYRSNLARSQSFNVHALPSAATTNGIYKSNPQLHRLDESPPPLKSPGILASISRSQRDLTNGHQDTKKRIFMQELRERAPELFKTLHGDEPVSRKLDYSSSFRSSSTAESPYRVNGGNTTSVVRRGSKGSDDYSETVRITSTSDDPARPSVTNTVQSFSKKTVPVRGGRSTETIESSETTTVTKSRFSPAARNGGVVIEVRPRK